LTTKSLQAQLNAARDKLSALHAINKTGNENSFVVNHYRAGFDSLAPLVIELAVAVRAANEIIILTHPGLSDAEMNTLTTRQYVLWKYYSNVLQKLEAYLNGGGK